MSNKKGFRTVVATIIITLVILAAISFAVVKYIAPAYQLTQNKIYQIAIKVFPLVVGITLIAIASSIAGSNDEEDEDDKLPPNSYDASLFDEPKDDPNVQASEDEAVQADETAAQEEEKPFVSVFESYSEDEGKEQEHEDVQPVEAIEVEEELTADEAVGTEEADEAAEDQAEQQPCEETPTEEASLVAAQEQEPQEAEEVAVEEQPKEDPNKHLIDAIMALVDKMDDFAAAVVYGTEDAEDEDDEDADYEDEEEEEDPLYEGLDRIEDQLEKLTSTIAMLSENLKDRVVVQPQPVAAPSCEPEQPVEEAKVVEEKAQPVEEHVETIVHVEPKQEVSKDDSGDILYRSYEGSEARQRTKAEYESAKEFNYDLTVAVIEQPHALTSLSLGETGDCLDVDGKTLAIIPFADEDEAKAELDKLEVPYRSRTYSAGSAMEYEELVDGLVEK